MPVTKITNVFEVSTGPVGVTPVRVGGWTESWYTNGGVSAAIGDNTAAGGLQEARAALLPTSGSIVGARYQLVDPPPAGASITRSAVLPGASGLDTDIPQMALQIRVASTNPLYAKQHIVRAIPDQCVVRGTYLPTPLFALSVTAYIHVLSSFMFRVSDKTVAFAALTGLNEVTGIGTTAAAHGLLIGNQVSTKGMKPANDPCGNSVSKRYIVIDVPTSNTFTFAIMPTGTVYVGGKFKKTSPIFVGIDELDTKPLRVTTRKTGRPFAQYRGRRSSAR